MKETNTYGVVYVLTNPAIPGLVKIGMTQREDINERLTELNKPTGIPVPFECQYACKVKASDCPKIEKALHTAFAPDRINPNREFFSTNIERIIPLLEIFNEGEITEEIAQEINDSLTADDKMAQEKLKRFRRPSLNYKEMGIEPGTLLFFTKDENIQVTVVNEKKVEYQNEIISLTALTTRLLGAERSVQPTRYWTVNGKNLKDIYDETYSLPIED